MKGKANGRSRTWRNDAQMSGSVLFLWASSLSDVLTLVVYFIICVVWNYVAWVLTFKYLTICFIYWFEMNIRPGSSSYSVTSKTSLTVFSKPFAPHSVSAIAHGSFTNHSDSLYVNCASSQNAGALAGRGSMIRISRRDLDGREYLGFRNRKRPWSIGEPLCS